MQFKLRQASCVVFKKLALWQLKPDVDSVGAACRMASNPVDPLQALSAALAVPPDSKEQADLLATLRESLEAHPSPIPILCTTLVKTVSGAGDSLLKRWVLDLLHFAICRSSLTLEVRTQRACQLSNP